MRAAINCKVLQYVFFLNGHFKFEKDHCCISSCSATFLRECFCKATCATTKADGYSCVQERDARMLHYFTKAGNKKSKILFQQVNILLQDFRNMVLIHSSWVVLGFLNKDHKG